MNQIGLVGRSTVILGLVSAVSFGVAQQQAPDPHRVGDVIASLLTFPQFQKEHGSGWVLADGRDVTGTMYFKTTANSRVPDLRGRVLRMVSDQERVGQPGGEDIVTLTIAQMPSHTHGKGFIRPDTGANAYAPNPPSGNLSNNWSWGNGQTDPAGGNQPVSLVPRHIGVNFYIKVD